MSRLRFPALSAVLCFALTAVAQAPSARDTAVRGVPSSENLSYHVEWRFIHAGDARLNWAAVRGGWALRLHLEAAGLVSKLLRVNDDYSALMNDHFCMVSSFLKAEEGNRRHETSVNFDAARRKARYTERDLVKNKSMSAEIDMRPCEHDVIAGLYVLRSMRLEPGHSVELPVSDGKKAAMVRVEAQERETIKTDYGTYKTIRCEAMVFNDVLYRRRGRLFVWLTDDDRRLPVQIRVRLPIYIGTVTLQLEKEGKA